MASLDARIITFEDLMSHLIRGEMSGSRTKGLEWVKEAVVSAYDAVCFRHRWDYYKKEYRIQINAPYSTGTIAYDHTGGASERMVTLTTGTWPSWAQYGRLRISNLIHDVATRESDTVLTLDSIVNPGADIASGTSYEIYRSVYPLPEDFLGLGAIEMESSQWMTWYISPDEWLRRERFIRSSGSPVCWTIMQNPDKTTDFAVFLDPPPDSAQPFSFIYRRRPRKIRWSGIEQQARNYTLSGSAGAATVTTSTALPSSMVGSILRISGDILDSSQPPTGLAGSNPFEEQHRIKSISSTTVTFDGTTLDNTYSSGTAFLVSDPIDASFSMIDAIKAEARAKLAEFSGDVEAIKVHREIANGDIRTAMENESRVDLRSGRGTPTWEYFNRPTILTDEG